MTNTHRKLTPGQIVAWNVTTDHGRNVDVLPDARLDSLVTSTELADAGWQLASFGNTENVVLVRNTGRVAWLAAFNTHVVIVEVADVGTSGDANGVVIATLGDKRRVRAFARLDTF